MPDACSFSHDGSAATWRRPSGDTTFGPQALARASRNDGCGADSVTTNVRSSRASVDVTLARKYDSERFGVARRAKEALTAAAVSGVPSWNVTPWRSVKV